jgi:hypothetical protein
MGHEKGCVRFCRNIIDQIKISKPFLRKRIPFLFYFIFLLYKISLSLFDSNETEKCFFLACFKFDNLKNKAPNIGGLVTISIGSRTKVC